MAPARRVGFAFHPSFLAHATGVSHPERPARLQAIIEYLRRVRCLDLLVPLDPPPAAWDQLALVHNKRYISEVEVGCREGPTAFDPDTIASPGSWEAALRAVGAVTLAVDHVLRGELDAAFCAVRPPGHHALPDQAMGFCLFNNIAIGVRYAQQHHKLQRILIVDWDAHHGNSTQSIFYEDPAVCYFSTHHFPFYPGSGARDEVGQGAGRGFTLNVPLPAGAGDPEMIRAFEEELVPKAMAFRPELIFISAGFDGHRDDPLGGLRCTETGYAELTRIVRRIAGACCGGRIVSALEGGYHLDALSRSVEAHLRVLLE